MWERLLKGLTVLSIGSLYIIMLGILKFYFALCPSIVKPVCNTPYVIPGAFLYNYHLLPSRPPPIKRNTYTFSIIKIFLLTGYVNLRENGINKAFYYLKFSLHNVGISIFSFLFF